MTAAGPFRRRSLISLLDAAQQGREPRRTWSRPTGVAQHVPLPELPVGRHLLSRFPIVEIPPGAHWEATEYESVTPWVCEFRDVLVHGDAGIICTADEAIDDTLGQTDPLRHHYEVSETGITLSPRDPATAIAGRCLSLLNFNPGNYFHWTIDGLGRLAAADQEALESCQHVLIPEPTSEFQTAGLDLTGLARTHSIRTVRPDESLYVESMIIPWTMTGDHRPHPRLREWFMQLAPAPVARNATARRIYIDRRASPNRRLVNEAEVIAALAPLGFVCVPLEELRLAEQISLFQGAGYIVAPHGAGLANVLFAPPGCRLLELHMDSYVHWCFRRLCAICGIGYDCVVGRQLPASPIGSIHAQQWSISITHLLGAVQQMLDKS